jgi:hypothetical protein
MRSGSLGAPQHKIIREVEYSSFIGAEEYAIGTFSLYTFNDGRLKILISEKVWRLLYLPR